MWTMHCILGTWTSYLYLKLKQIVYMWYLNVAKIIMECLLCSLLSIFSEWDDCGGAWVFSWGQVRKNFGRCLSTEEQDVRAMRWWDDDDVFSCLDWIFAHHDAVYKTENYNCHVRYLSSILKIAHLFGVVFLWSFFDVPRILVDFF